MASLERLSQVPELLSWFREGMAQQGRTEAEIARCELELLDQLAEEEKIRQRARRRRTARVEARRHQLTLVEDGREPDNERWSRRVS
jgi:hypothetical protein